MGNITGLATQEYKDADSPSTASFESQSLSDGRQSYMS